MQSENILSFGLSGVWIWCYRLVVHFGFALGGVGVGLQVPNGLRSERIFVVLGRVRGLWPLYGLLDWRKGGCLWGRSLPWRDCSIDFLVYVDAAWVGGFEIGGEGDG